MSEYPPLSFYHNPCGTGTQIHLLFSHSQVYNNFYQNVKQDDVVGKSVKMYKNQRYFKCFLGLGIPLILYFYLVMQRELSPLYPLARAIVAWVFQECQGKCHKIITFLAI
jgi:hypothetical protein